MAGQLWQSVFFSTACFTLAISGVAFTHARLGMVCLMQVGLIGVGGRVMRLSRAFGLLAGSPVLPDGGTFQASESVMLFALAVIGGARFWLGAHVGLS